MSSCYSGFEDRSFEFDDSSFDSGYEKSFETDCNVTPRRLLFDAAADLAGAINPNAADISVSTFNGLLDTSSNHSCRSARTLVEHVISKAPPIMDKDLDSDGFNPSETSTPTKGDATEPRPKRKYAVGKNRVTRSRSPLQVIRIKKFRRMKANDRERNRMHMLNDALERLRITLPSLPEETKLTKIEVLRFAYNYIYALEQVLESGGTINLDLEKLQNFTLSGERITKELFDALFVNPQPYPTILGMGMVSYAMAARLPYGSATGSNTNCPNIYTTHATYQQDYNQPQTMQEQQSTNTRNQQNNYEQHYYDHATYEAAVTQSNISTSAHKMDNPHFSAEKYELFKQTFETAANIVRGPDAGSTGYIYASQDAGYAQLTPSGVYDTSSSIANNNNNRNSTTTTPTALHQQSSFYSQTPPWKDFNELLINTNNSNFDSFTTTGV